MLDGSMYLRRVHIQNIRSIAELDWELPHGVAGAGWHVILGDNGAGKSTFLRSLALALVGDSEAAGLRQSWREWLRNGETAGRISMTIVPAAGVDGAWPADAAVPDEVVELHLKQTETGTELVGVRHMHPARHPWHSPKGWFSASYGPFRRFTGGDKDLEKLFTSQPKLARHLSVFGEAVALTEALSWLQSLKFKQLEGNVDGGLLLPITTFINQPDFLPHGVRLHDITSSGVEFVDAGGVNVPVQQLSDGYRSILSMTFELVRQMAATYGVDGLFSTDSMQVVRPGVVIVDEIDAHLHPTWQRTVGGWFRKHFPNVQFIVSTHSPLICQAAEVGSIFRLPRPGADPADDQGGMVHGVALERLLYGDVLDAYSTGVFGAGVTRSDSGQDKLDKLAELNTLELVRTLSSDEQEDQTRLRRILPTDASTTTTP